MNYFLNSFKFKRKITLKCKFFVISKGMFKMHQLSVIFFVRKLYPHSIAALSQFSLPQSARRLVKCIGTLLPKIFHAAKPSREAGSISSRGVSPLPFRPSKCKSQRPRGSPSRLCGRSCRSGDPVWERKGGGYPKFKSPLYFPPPVKPFGGFGSTDISFSFCCIPLRNGAGMYG